MTLAERIKNLRNSKGLTQQDLADRVGVSMHTVFRWEKGNRSPDARELMALSKELQVSVSYIIGESDNDTIATLGDIVTMEVAPFAVARDAAKKYAYKASHDDRVEAMRLLRAAMDILKDAEDEDEQRATDDRQKCGGAAR